MLLLNASLSLLFSLLQCMQDTVLGLCKPVHEVAPELFTKFSFRPVSTLVE